MSSPILVFFRKLDFPLVLLDTSAAYSSEPVGLADIVLMGEGITKVALMQVVVFHVCHYTRRRGLGQEQKKKT